MPEGVRLSHELPRWTRMAIAEAVVLFGRMEQKIIEIAWLLTDADLKAKLRLTKESAKEKFIEIIESFERAEVGLKLDGLKNGVTRLSDERNLIVHGSWTMVDYRPWVVWHKFLQDDDSVIGEYFDKSRFERFMTVGERLLGTLRKFHDILEEQSGKKTTAVPRP